MRYELGVLQLLVASGGKRRPARVEVVERALGVRRGALDPAIRLLQGRGLLNQDGQPSDAGVARAKDLKQQERLVAPAAHLPARVPASSGVFQKEERDAMNDFDGSALDEPRWRSA